MLAQTVSTQVLKELTVYYGAAARLIANTITSVNGVQPDRIVDSNDRKQLVDELKSISFSISSLRVRQTPLVASLLDYVDQVRAGKLNGSDRNRKWGSIVVSSTSLKGTVATTLHVVEKSRYLTAGLDERDRLALREALLGRGLVLDEIRSLQVPGTQDEIDQLEKMNKFYSQLVKSLSDLNIALLKAIDRLNAQQ